jgi:hypothetical protein
MISVLIGIAILCVLGILYLVIFGLAWPSYPGGHDDEWPPK